MDKQDLDLLLQARTSELQHEYENLVRSLDAAYEAVKAIGRDIAENRAEARRLFDTRLKLARGDDLEAVLRLCSTTTATTTTTTTSSDAVIATQQNCNNNNTTNGRKPNNNDQIPGMVRLYVQQSDANSTTRSPQHANHETQQQPRVVTVTSTVNEALPRLRAKKILQSFDPASSSLNERFRQQQRKQHQQHEQPHYSPVYVGDDHSYAVNEDEDEDLAEHQLMLEEELTVNAATADAKRKKCGETHAAGIDLSIVKTEVPDDSIEEQNPLVDRQSKIVKPVTVTKTSKITTAFTNKVSSKLRKIMETEIDEEIVRKRKQTRERMRRWRAKKKMEELNAKQPYKYKLYIAKTAST